MSTKSLYIKTWGCQMNVYDSAKMADVLAPLGYKPVTEPDGADMVILNTCHIREKAAEKLYSELGRLRKLQEAKKTDGGKMIMAVAGCVAQAEGKEIMRRTPYVDMVFGPQTYHQLPEMVGKLDKGRVVNTDMPVEAKFDTLPQESGNQGVSAFLSVQEGCDKFCSFCVVPYTRGSEYSRPVSQIITDAKRLIELGTREITLLGQNVNAYHGEAADGKSWSLGRLIFELAEMDGLDRIRFTTSHPRDMDDELIEAHGTCDKLMPYLHLPIQSGSDNILKAMNRKHVADEYRKIVDRLRTARSDLALSGDFIVGFPGETDADFADTLKLVSDVEYAQAYSFKYSPRPGTPASVSNTQVDEAVKSERLEALQQLLRAQQLSFNASKVGQTMPILFDRKGKQDGQLLGKSPWMQSVYVQGNERLRGQIVDVKITEAHQNSISGEIVTDETVLNIASNG